MLYFDLDENKKPVNYGGIMYELLLFMQKARDAVSGVVRFCSLNSDI